jgi:hypothetical protein
MSRALAFVCLLISPSVALAKPKPPAPARKAEPAQKAQRMVFGDGDTLEVDRVAPDGDLIHGKPPIVNTSLIVVRWSFYPEMMRTADNH